MEMIEFIATLDPQEQERYLIMRIAKKIVADKLVKDKQVIDVIKLVEQAHITYKLQLLKLLEEKDSIFNRTAAKILEVAAV